MDFVIDLPKRVVTQADSLAAQLNIDRNALITRALEALLDRVAREDRAAQGGDSDSSAV